MSIENINWYPGHMKKTRELIKENMKMVDAVIEVVDARIPVSSRNPIIHELTGSKTRVIVLNKSDLSDEKANELWAEKMRAEGSRVIIMNCMSGEGVKRLFKMLEEEQARKNSASQRVSLPCRRIGRSRSYSAPIAIPSAKASSRERACARRSTPTQPNRRDQKPPSCAGSS